LSEDYQVIARRPITQAKKYEASSAVRFKTQPITPEQKRLGLQLPSDVSPQVRALAQRWRRESRTPQEIVQKALLYFRQQPFIYTLQPPLLGNDPTHEFLFETRRGFCEHFATSFTLLMRLAGIPSRLVTGYLGGELNPRGGYLIVRQSDAHAWSEVWLDGIGWQRVDPTAAVAPERIEHALDIAANLTDGGAALFRIDNPQLFHSLARNLRWTMDALHLSWQRWIINYDRSRQRSFLSLFGLRDFSFQHLTSLAIALVMTGLLLFYLWIQRRDRRHQDPVTTAYQLFLARMNQAGIAHPPHQGPLDFLRHIEQTRPELMAEVAPIINDYIRLRYGAGDRSGLQGFIERCRGFKAKQG
jgi:hypothetical protein